MELDVLIQYLVFHVLAEIQTVGLDNSMMEALTLCILRFEDLSILSSSLNDV